MKKSKYLSSSSPSSSSSSSLISPIPKGGLSDLILLKIINDLECNQDIVCLLMTCKAYYREFMKQYEKVITFKVSEPFEGFWSSEKVNFDFQGDIPDILALFSSIDSLKIEFMSIIPPSFPNITQWPCTLTSLYIESPTVLPVGIQFPVTLTSLIIAYFHFSGTFSLDLSNLIVLADLDVRSPTTSSDLIPATNIRFPNPSSSLTSLNLCIPLDTTTMTQSFFPTNLQVLRMGLKYFGSTKPPPTVTRMDIRCDVKIPNNFFPPSLLELTIVLVHEATLDPWMLKQGLKYLHIRSDKAFSITPEIIPDSVTFLSINVDSPNQAVFPSKLEVLSTTINFTSPSNYPPTLRELVSCKSSHPPPIIYLPTSLEEVCWLLVKIKDTNIYTLPTTMIINNDNSSPTDNPPHFILPYRLKNLLVLKLGDFKKDFSIRIDQIINCSNVEHLVVGSRFNLNIRRLDNGDVMLNCGDTFFGGIYRQQRRMENISIENRSALDFRALYLNFKVKGNHIYIYPSNTPIENK
ncbi:hypothetical protein DFA_09291 [Cavenderia fasciculata]|uniref:F-box domain-containing protein n=1 Tax=Cavenderia fasciculata TaxID=261658 RepID=F4Q779_CACFS|nr:uncharacterized protein DFA_09291 [Cavenderia fasciculata]EGG16261.1 hypothetical protein DFA_09291 [Cavenderia fasciculata]|eukprot:XP_004354645.1 hypothetical protein DFA_09291 [Cavenderia fasciculata]